jgi:hypothetical protein
VQASQVLRHRSRQTISVLTSLCALGHCHAETGKGLPQTIATKLEARNRLESHCMLQHYNLHSVELRGLAQTMKNSPRLVFLLHQTLLLALCIRVGSISWHQPNPD